MPEGTPFPPPGPVKTRASGSGRAATGGLRPPRPAGPPRFRDRTFCRSRTIAALTLKCASVNLNLTTVRQGTRVAIVAGGPDPVAAGVGPSRQAGGWAAYQGCGSGHELASQGRRRPTAAACHLLRLRRARRHLPTERQQPHRPEQCGTEAVTVSPVLRRCASLWRSGVMARVGAVRQMADPWRGSGSKPGEVRDGQDKEVCTIDAGS